MVRTKIETFIYSVIDRNTKQVIGSFESTEELKTQKAKTAAVAAAGFSGGFHLCTNRYRIRPLRDAGRTVFCRSKETGRLINAQPAVWNSPDKT